MYLETWVFKYIPKILKKGIVTLGLLGPGGTAFIKVYMLSPELVESAGLGMMGVPGGPPPPGGP